MPDLIAFDTEDDAKRFSDAKQDRAGYGEGSAHRLPPSTHGLASDSSPAVCEPQAKAGCRTLGMSYHSLSGSWTPGGA